MWRVAFALLSRQVIYLNLMGCIIGSFDHWAYTIYFWALAQSTTPKHEAQRDEVVIVVVAMIVGIVGDNRPLFSFVRIAISL
jgi:hypothetical protein